MDAILPIFQKLLDSLSARQGSTSLQELVYLYALKALKDKQFSTSLLIGIISMLLWGLLASWHNASLDSFYIGWLTSTLTFFFFKYKNKGKTL
jgi:hypothetical protein